MCGIAGIYGTKEAQDDRRIVAGMLTRLQHRGPDGSGLVNLENATLGHRRLKIIDLTDAAQQPMVSHSGRYVISFNGECYNFKELQRELGLADDKLRSTSDTEILLEAWAAWGQGALARLAGQFAFAVYDRQEKCLWLARDRFGEKPLFYHSDGKRLSFASSIGALLAAPEVSRELDPQALREYTALRYVVSPRTVVRGVLKLPPGGLLKIDESGLTVSRWYETQFQRDERAAGDSDLPDPLVRFNGLFQKAVERCLVSDVPVGLLLSDGLDSNSILSALRVSGRSVPCFTFKSCSAVDGEHGFADVRGPADLPTHEFTFTADERVASMKPAFASLTEPVGDGASLATWLLLHKIRDQAKVFLCGHGADELLGGYRLSQDRFRLRVLRYTAMFPWGPVKDLLGRYFFGYDPIASRVSAIRALNRERLPEGARYLIHRPLPLDDLTELFGNEVNSGVDSSINTVEELYDRCVPQSDDIDRMQKVLADTFLTENILSFADSVAMDSSVELRMPFLDRDLAAFVTSLPSHERVGYWPTHANTKKILRRWRQNQKDLPFTQHRKRSFDFGSLRPLLASSQSREIRSYVLDSSAIKRNIPGIAHWMSHPPEYYHGCCQGTLWALIALGVWCDANGIS